MNHCSNDLPPNPRPRRVWTIEYVRDAYERGILDSEDVEQFCDDILTEVSDVLPAISRYWVEMARLAQGGVS